MKGRILVLLILSLLISSTFAVERQVTYQGKLTDSDGVGINGSYDMTFSLYDDLAAGTLVDEHSITGVSIQKGLFSVELTFDLTLENVMDPLYLQITIDGDVMSPRELMSTELFTYGSYYSFYSDSADYADVAEYSDTTGAVAWEDITGRPVDFGGFQRLRGQDGVWLEDSASFVGGSGISVVQDGDTITITATGSPDNIFNQDTIAQSEADFWIDGDGTFGGTTSYGDQVITTGDGSGSAYTRPLNGDYTYARNVNLILAEELGSDGSCTIDQIEVYMNDVTSCPENPWVYYNVHIYFELVSSDVLTSTWDVSTATEVFTTTELSIPATVGWKTIDVDDFTYDGTSNLRIYFQNQAIGLHNSNDAPEWRYTTQSTNTLASYFTSDSYFETTQIPTYYRPDFRISLVDMPTVIDQVSITNGYIDLDNDLTSSGDIAGETFTLNGITISSWDQTIEFDTISSEITDTIVLHDAFKVTGELIADSIQAVGDTVHIDDNMHARCALFQEPQDRDILLSESFEALVPPATWTEDSTNVLDSTWHHSNASIHWGGYSAGIITANGAQDEWIITPNTFIPPTGTYYLTFWSDIYWGSAPTNNDDYLVKVTTDGGGSWTTVASFADSSAAGRHSWDQMYMVDLTAFSGSAVQVGFHATGTSGIKHNWYVDDVSIFAYVGTLNPAVEICDGNISADGNLEATGIILDGVLRETWPTSSGSADADTLSATRHEIVVVDEDFEVIGRTYVDTVISYGDTLILQDNVKVVGDLVVTGSIEGTMPFDTLESDIVDTIVVNQDFKVVGELIADSIQAVGDFIEMDDKIIANFGLETDSIRLGGVTRTEWPEGAHLTLDDAYDNFGGSGQNVTVDEGMIHFRNTASPSGTIMRISSNDAANPSLYTYNSSGTAIYCAGDLRMPLATGKRIYSVAGNLNMQINAPTTPGGTGSVDPRFFRIWDTDENELFTVDMDSHAEAHVFVADSFELGGVKIGAWPGGGSGSDADWTIAGNFVYNQDDSVGIGTSTPTSKLHVSSNAVADLAVVTIDNTTLGDTNSIALKASTNATTNGNGIGIVGEGATGVKGLANGSITTGTNYGLYGTAANSSIMNIGVYGAGSDWAGYFDGDAYVANDLQIDGAINDGTGTGTAGDVLVADGTGGMAWQAPGGADGDWTIDGTHMYSSVSGNVAIGSSSYTHKLTVEGDDNSVLRLIGIEGTYGYGARLNFGDEDWAYIEEDTDDNLTIFAERIALMPDGVGVGINTLSPIYELEVNGDIGISGGIFDGTFDSGSAGEVITSDGAGGWNWTVPTAAVRFDTLDATAHTVVVVTDDMQIDGITSTDNLAAVNDSIIVADDVHFDNAITLGGVSRTSWPGGAGNLDEAYDGGATITVDAGEVKLDGDYLTSGSGRILNVLGNDDTDEMLQVANGGTAPAIYSAGDFRIQNGDYFLSRGDLKFQLDNGGAFSTVNKFSIHDDALVEVFSIDERGDLIITGGIDDGSGSFGTNAQVLTADGSGDISWEDISFPSVRFDTINATAHDTVVVSENMKVVGELITDSIQAVGDEIMVDDDIFVDGGIEMLQAPIGAGMHNFRDDWEPENIITVGGNNADFYDLDSAIVYALSVGNKALKIAPGLYMLAMAHNISPDIAMIGSGYNTTTIAGAQITFSANSIANGITFDGDLTSAGTHNQCYFASGTHLFTGAIVNDSKITSNASFTGNCIISDAHMAGVFSVSDGTEFEGCFIEGTVNISALSNTVIRFTGCKLHNAVVTLQNEFVRGLFDACEFESSRIVGTFGGSLDVKACHFYNITDAAAIDLSTDLNATILSNDFINVTNPIVALNPKRLRIIGNSIESNSITLIGINIDGSISTELVIIKDNQIEDCQMFGLNLLNLSDLTPGRLLIDNNAISGCNTGMNLNGTTTAIISHNNVCGNTTDINGAGLSTISNNVVDIYLPAGPYPGAFNTNSAGIMWGGLQPGQLP